MASKRSKIWNRAYAKAVAAGSHAPCTYATGYEHGHRANRLTRAQLAVVEAMGPLLERVLGHKCKACGGVEDHLNDCPALAAQKAVDALERAKGRK